MSREFNARVDIREINFNKGAPTDIPSFRPGTLISNFRRFSDIVNFERAIMLRFIRELSRLGDLDTDQVFFGSDRRRLGPYLSALLPNRTFDNAHMSTDPFTILIVEAHDQVRTYTTEATLPKEAGKIQVQSTTKIIRIEDDRLVVTDSRLIAGDRALVQALKAEERQDRHLVKRRSNVHKPYQAGAPGLGKRA